MKKHLTMLASLLAVVFLTACGSSLDAFELFELHTEATADAPTSGMTMTMEMDMTVVGDGLTIQVPMTMTMEMESEERTSLTMNASFMGEAMHMEMYTRDGYTYTREDDSGFVTMSREANADVDDAEMDAMMEEIEAIMGDVDFWQDWVIDSSAESVDDGYRLEFVYDLGYVFALLLELDLPGFDEFFDEFGDVFGDDEALEGTITYVLYIDEDHLLISSEGSMELEFETEIDGIDFEMQIDVTFTMTVGEVTIDFPAWLEEAAAAEAEIDEVENAADLIGTWVVREAALVGAWEDWGFMWIFFADGTGYEARHFDYELDFADPFTWEIEDGNVLVLDFDGDEERHLIDVDGDTFTRTGILLGGALNLTFDYTRMDIDVEAFLAGDLDAADDADDVDVDENDGDDVDADETGADDAEPYDWRAFIADYEDFVLRFIDLMERVENDPEDFTILIEMVEMMAEVEEFEARSEAIIDHVPAGEQLEFLEELLRILELLMDAMDDFDFDF